ncbi:MAG: trimethylamine methyltransferase family protein [Desulfobacterales bacterium]|nr:trimethylamine methyltransferase family protein [Desulfobacterales bacterium]
MQFLSEKEIQNIHASSLKILSTTGMHFPAQEALAAFEKAGCRIQDSDRVLIPSELVADALKKVPKRNEVTLYGRDPQFDVKFTQHIPSLSCMTMATNVMDPHSLEKRAATNEDLAHLTRLAHDMECVAVNGGLVTPQEVPGAVNDWYTWATCMKNTTKHITGGVYGYQGVLDAIEMGAIACGSKEKFLERPFISGWVLTIPPLDMDTASLEAMIEMNRHHIPIMLSSGPILGTTSPVTIAATLAQAHAEILACITLAQLIKPGAPVVYTSFARGMNMKTSNISMAGPEFAVLKACMSQMGLSLDLPIRMPSMLRDSKVLDAQAGFETGMVGTLSSFGADIMDSMQLDTDLVVDYADVVFCNDAMANIRHALRDLDVNEDTLALDVIDEIGPRGTFLGHRHTFKNFKTELLHSDVMDHNNWERWEQLGAKDIRQVCLEKVKGMMEEEKEPFLTPEQEAAIDAIVEKASQDLAQPDSAA